MVKKKLPPAITFVEGKCPQTHFCGGLANGGGEMLREMSPTLTFVEPGLQFELQGVKERKQSLHWDCALGSGSGPQGCCPLPQGLIGGS